VAQTAVFKESDAPSIGVIGGVAAPLGKPPKAERNVRGGIAVHTKQLAHK
jgi:hypothetical protein